MPVPSKIDISFALFLNDPTLGRVNAQIGVYEVATPPQDSVWGRICDDSGVPNYVVLQGKAGPPKFVAESWDGTTLKGHSDGVWWPTNQPATLTYEFSAKAVKITASVGGVEKLSASGNVAGAGPYKFNVS